MRLPVHARRLPHAAGPEVGEVPGSAVLATVALLAGALSSGAVELRGGISGLLDTQVAVRDLLLTGGVLLVWWKTMQILRRSGWGGGSRVAEGVRIAVACLIGTGAATALGGFSPALFWLGSVAAAVSVQAVVRGLTVRPQSAKPRRVVIVGSGPRALGLYDELRSAPEGTYELLGFIDSDTHIAPAELRGQRLGGVEALDEILLRQVVDEVLIALPVKSHYSEIQRAIETCERAGVESKYLADVFDCSVAKPCYEPAGKVPVVAMKVTVPDYRRIVKRVLDLVVAAAGLVLLAPLLLAIALAIRATSPGPAIFAQERYGFGKRRFRMYKFRTMVANAEELQHDLEERNEVEGPVFKIRDDPRVTALGRFLRRTSLDEVPQLWNVVRGEMSLVGPRPLPERDVHLFDESWLMRRFSVPPGITGLWQVHGRSDVGFDDWMALDLRYIDQWSPMLDLELLLRTVPAVLRGKGAV